VANALENERAISQILEIKERESEIFFTLV